MIRLLTALLLIVSAFTSAMAGVLFVGLENTAPSTYSSDLFGFPDVTWDSHFSFDVSGAAATPDGDLYVCNGAFTTRLYEASLDGSPTLLSTISVDISALAYGRDTLYGYSNYATPKGIYSIEPSTGQATLVLDVYTGYSFRFFGLGYNPLDDLFYGYTEYGDAGLYSINIDTGEMLKIADTIPASNGQGRGLAVGNATVYLTATRGDDDIPFFAYDLSQGAGGEWIGFTNAYPTQHATGAAAWIPSPTAVDEAGTPESRILLGAYPNPFNPRTSIQVRLEKAGQLELSIFTPEGRLVTTLFEGQAAAGNREFVWDGHDSAGHAAASGVYQVRVSLDGHREMQNLVLLK